MHVMHGGHVFYVTRINDVPDMHRWDDIEWWRGQVPEVSGRQSIWLVNERLYGLFEGALLVRRLRCL